MLSEGSKDVYSCVCYKETWHDLDVCEPESISGAMTMVQISHQTSIISMKSVLAKMNLQKVLCFQ